MLSVVGILMIITPIVIIARRYGLGLDAVVRFMAETPLQHHYIVRGTIIGGMLVLAFSVLANLMKAMGQ